jgi:hypothetical protein
MTREIDITLMDETYGYIEANPLTWNQDDWVCGTKFCFAGHAAVTLGGAKQDTTWPDFVYVPDGESWVFEGKQRVGGDRMFIADYAIVRLGLTMGQADDLFDGGNTLVDLRRVIDKIAASVPQEEGEEE